MKKEIPTGHRNMRAAFILCSLVVLCALSGCILTPIISSMREMGVSKSARVELLQRGVRDFHLALQMNDPIKASAYLSREEEQLVQDLMTEMRRRKREERVVDSDVDFIDIAEDGYTANVEVSVQYFQVPYYVVNTRTERERWEFSTRKGWKVVRREVVDAKA